MCHSNIIDEIFDENDFDIFDDSVNNKVILTTNNIDVLELNDQVLKELKGDSKDYFSVDTASDDN